MHASRPSVDAVRFVAQPGTRFTQTDHGTGMGLVLAFVALHVSASAIKGRPAPDPMAFALVPVVLAAAVLVASLSPPLRASRTDPAVVMRGE